MCPARPSLPSSPRVPLFIARRSLRLRRTGYLPPGRRVKHANQEICNHNDVVGDYAKLNIRFSNPMLAHQPGANYAYYNCTKQ